MINDVQLVTKFNQISNVLVAVLVVVLVVSVINVVIKKESFLNIVGLLIVCSLVIFMVQDQKRFIELGQSVYSFFMKV